MKLLCKKMKPWNDDKGKSLPEIMKDINRIIYERKERVGIGKEVRHDYFSAISRKFMRRKSAVFRDEPLRKQMVVFADDYISNKILSHRIYEKQQLEILINWIKASGKKHNHTVLDIGANIGNHSLYFSRHFGKCLSFEPNPRTFELLRINAGLVNNIVPVNLGLSDKKGEAELHINVDNTGASSLSESWNDNADVKHTISLVALDDIVGQDEVIDLIKIDVEGHEWYALKGAERTILKHKPLIVFEYNGNDNAARGKDVLELLKDYGYSDFFEIIDGWELFNSELRRYPGILRLPVKYLLLLLGKQVVHQIRRIDNFQEKQYLMVIAIME